MIPMLTTSSSNEMKSDDRRQNFQQNMQMQSHANQVTQSSNVPQILQATNVEQIKGVYD